MNRKQIITLMLAVTCILTPIASAEVTIIDHDAVIESGDYYERLAIRSNAIVSITGGTIEELFVLDSATVNISGGKIGYEEGIFSQDCVLIYDVSSINISDDSRIFGNIYGYGESTITISGGLVKSYDLELHDSSTLNYYGGKLVKWRDNITCGFVIRDSSTLNFYGGDPSPDYGEYTGIRLDDNAKGYFYDGSVSEVTVQDNSVFYMMDGNISDISATWNTEFGGIYLGGNATAYLSGGYIHELGGSENREYIPETTSIHIFGNNLYSAPFGGSQNSLGILTGSWQNGEYFNIDLDDGYSYSHVILHEGEQPPIPPDANALPDFSQPENLSLETIVFKLGKKPNSDSLLLKGKITLPPGYDLLSGSIVVSWCNEEVTIPISNIIKTKNKHVFVYKKVQSDTKSRYMVEFDLNTGEYEVIFKKVSLGSMTGPLTLFISFGDLRVYL